LVWCFRGTLKINAAQSEPGSWLVTHVGGGGGGVTRKIWSEFCVVTLPGVPNVGTSSATKTSASCFSAHSRDRRPQSAQQGDHRGDRCSSAFCQRSTSSVTMRGMITACRSVSSTSRTSCNRDPNSGFECPSRKIRTSPRRHLSHAPSLDTQTLAPNTHQPRTCVEAVDQCRSLPPRFAV
jgi:hypothetical protein